MKLQQLTVIFIIIVLPLILVLSTYIGLQIDTLYLQTSYNTKLNDATHDAMQAFQINTQNNDYSTVADSLKRDVAASINTFYSSLASNMGVSGYSQEELHPYIPAVLFTMYDGYYIYSPTKTEAAAGADDESESLLKQYIYYSARYVNSSNNTDVVINYSLDSYISVYGRINGNYIARSGYLIQYKDNGTGTTGLTKVKFEDDSISNPDDFSIVIDGYTIGSGSKIIKDGRVWSDASCTNEAKVQSIIYNGKEIESENGVVVRGDNNQFIKKDRAEPGNIASKEALTYYIEALEFSKYIADLGLNTIINNAATEVYINDQKVYKQGDADNKIIAPNNLFNLEATDPENIKSSFVTHKREIIRLNIENNLQNAFNNYKGTVGNNYDYQLPKFKEEEWEKIYKNISVVTFMQGIQVGSKMYNNYSIVTSTGNEEYVDPEELYFLNESDKTYRRITDESLTATKGYRSSMFETRNKVNGDDDKHDILAGVLGTLYTADYATIVNGKANSVYNEETGELIKEVNKTGTTDPLNDYNIKAYYTTLARERYELLKLRATGILNTSQKIKTNVLASAQSIGIDAGQFSASLRPANQFTNKECNYSIINTRDNSVITTGVEECDENGKLQTQDINELDENTTYKVNVSAIDNYGRTVSDTATFTTGHITVDPPVITQVWSEGKPEVSVKNENYVEGHQIHIQKYVENDSGELIEYGDEIVEENQIKTFNQADIELESTRIKEVIAKIKDSNTGRESVDARKNIDDVTAPVIDILEENLVTTEDSITFNIEATDLESGFNENSKFDVKIFSEDENIIEGVGGEFGERENSNKLVAEGITYNNLVSGQNYYIQVKVEDRYGNIGEFTTKGKYTITIAGEETVPDAKIELIPDDSDDSNDSEDSDDSDDVPSINPSDEKANIIVRFSPTYYVDGENSNKRKQGYLGSGEKVIVKLEKKLENSNYSIQYKEYGEDSWNNYEEPIEISNNTSYLVRFIGNNNVVGEPDVFNIKNIDKKAPEINLKEDNENPERILITAEDSGESNSGLKEFKIEKVKADNTKTEIKIDIGSYNEVDNSGDTTRGGVLYEIYDEEREIYKKIIAIAIDCVGRESAKTINLHGDDSNPVIELISVTNDNSIDKNYANKNHNIEIKFKITDEYKNIDLQELTSNAFEVKVGEELANLNYDEISKQGDTYTVKINGITGDGELKVKVKEGIVKDIRGNANEEINLIPNTLSNVTNGYISHITIDNTAPKITLTANPQDVSIKAIEANKINQDGKSTIINAEIEDMFGIYTYTYKIKDKYSLKEEVVNSKIFDYEYLKETIEQNLTTTFGIYDVTIDNVQDRAGNSLEEGQTIQVYDYTIKTKEEMKLLQQYVEKGESFAEKTVTLLNDIDLEGSEDNQWTPIGSRTNKFSGNFDGQNYKVSGIYIYNTERDQGLFGMIENGEIKNLGVDGSITGMTNLGGIVGYKSNGKIENCYNIGNVSGISNVGGIVGYSLNRGKIENCYNIGNVNGDDRTGGIVGNSTGYGIVKKCYNTGNVTGNNMVGGIAGYLGTGTIENCYNEGSIIGDEYTGGIVGNGLNKIKNCYNTGSIKGKQEVGGIVGENDTGAIENCYNTGSITGDTYLGGVVGVNTGNGKIINCYNTGSMTGERLIGGIVGNKSNGTIENCYYNSETSNATDNYAQPKTTQEMKAPEFVLTLGIENWKEDHMQDGREQINNGYPILKWQEGKETVIIEEKEVGLDTIRVKATATDANYAYYKYYIDGKLKYTGQEQEYTFEGLRPSTIYSIEVYAYKDANYSEEDRLYGKKEIQTAILPIIRVETPKVGQTATFQVVNKEELPQNVEFKWYRNKQETTEGATEIAGEEESTFIESAADVVLYEDYYYYCSIVVNGKEYASEPLQLKVNYTINTKAELEGVRDLVNSGELAESVMGLKGKTVYLGNDINLNGSETDQWTPIGSSGNSYKGNFDGQGYLISGIYIKTENDEQGLFERIEKGVIRNLGVDGSITGKNYVAGIVGGSQGAIIENCYNKATITGNGDNAVDGSSIGGIAGFAFIDTTIANCYNEGIITGNHAVGGIAGEFQTGMIENCYNTGKVTGVERISHNITGGIVGSIGTSLPDSATIENCYNIGTVVMGDEIISDVIGAEHAALHSNIYSLVTPEIDGCMYAQPKTTQEMKAPEFVLALGIENWKEDHMQEGREQINDGYPILKWQEGKETVIIEEKEVGLDTITVKATATDANYAYYKYYIDGKLKYTGQEQEYIFEGLRPSTIYSIEVYAYKDANYSEEDRLYGEKEIQTSSIPVVNLGIPKVGQTATFQVVNKEELPQNVEFKWYRNNKKAVEGATEIAIEVEGTLVESAANVVLYENYYYYCSIVVNGKEYTSVPIQLKVNYTISTKAELEGVRDLVNSGELAESVKGLKGKTVYLGNDINLNGSETDQWTPIGSFQNNYQGNFDGQGYLISGIYINTKEMYQGLFGYKVNGTIKNVGVDGSITGRILVGGIVGQNIGAIENCYNKGSIIGTGNYVGGIVGQNIGAIENCYNEGNIKGNTYVGGISGYNSNNGSSISNSYNIGCIEGSSNIGGIVGYNASNSNNGGSISNSYNKGNIKGNTNVGGIAGYNDYKIENSYNTERIEGNTYVGGLAGQCNNGGVSNSHNTGNIEGNTYVGGLAGQCNNGEVSNSHNTGNIIGIRYVGGITGKYTDGGVSNSHNTGNIEGNTYVGGLAGECRGPMKDSYNTGRVDGNTYVGGLAGNNYDWIMNSYNSGEVIGLVDGKYVGGIAGINNDRITNSYNIGNITGNTYVGGLAGNNDSWIMNSYNSGEVIGLVDGKYVGGIAGINSDRITNSYNKGSITGDTYVGGIVGYTEGEISDSYNKGSITGDTYVGGIVGYNCYRILNSYNTGRIEGNTYVGGVVGDKGNSPTGEYVTTSNCYYNSETSNATDNSAQPKTTQEMKAPEFVLTLKIENWKEDHMQDGREQINDGYPILKWQEGKETVIIEEKEVGLDTIRVKATATDVNYTYYKYYINGELKYTGQEQEYTFQDLENSKEFAIEVYAYKDANYSEEDRLYGEKTISALGPILSMKTPKIGEGAGFSIINRKELPSDITWDLYTNKENSTEGGIEIVSDLKMNDIRYLSNIKTAAYDNNYFYCTIVVNEKEYTSIPVQLKINYTLETKEELEDFRDFTNKKETVKNLDGSEVKYLGSDLLEGKTVYLGNNIDLNPGFTFEKESRISVEYTIDSNKTTKTEPDTWKPIATYKGTLDGQGYTIKGLYRDYSGNDDICMAFIQTVNETATIKNLTIDGAMKEDASKDAGNETYIGGICFSNYGHIYNCHNEAKIIGECEEGGIAVNNYGTIELCSNKGRVLDSGGTSSWDITGGIAASNYGTIKNCYNEGVVYSGHYNGGIVGYNSGTIEGCYNSGALNPGNSKGYSAGIVSYNTSDGIIRNCYNKQKENIEVEILGEQGNSKSIAKLNKTIKNCYTSTNRSICGRWYDSSNSIKNEYLETCYSLADYTEEFMKSPEFVELLGTEYWKQDTNNINNGYPILKWQE